MASLRRSKTLSPDGQTARFLYTIIKQLDLKTIDWNEVASTLDITNGHAARMRFSRFKQHIEGTPTQPRAQRAKKDGEKTTKRKGKGKGVKRPWEEEDTEKEAVKGEAEDEKSKFKQKVGISVKQEAGLVVKQQPAIMMKQELRSEDCQPSVAKIKREPSAEASAHPPRSTTGPQSAVNNVMPMIKCLPSPLPPATIAAIAAKGPASPAPLAAPPLATVSLADLQLPLAARPRLLPAPPTEPNYVLQANPLPMTYPVTAETPRFKIEPEVELRLLSSPPIIIKQESLDV